MEPMRPPVHASPALAAGPFRVREMLYAPGVRQRTHTHPCAGVTLVLAGAIREEAAGTDEIGSALSLVVKPADFPHADLVGPRGARTLQIALVDGADAAAWPSVPRDDTHLGRWRWLHARPAASAMFSLFRLVRSGASADALCEGIVETLSALPEDAPLSGRPPAWLRRAREALDDATAKSASVAELARDVGAHPVSLSRAFRRHYRCSVTEYRRRQRLQRAAAAIESSAHDLSRIAQDAGYADHPHLCREFRSAAGVSPSRFRALVRAG